MANAVSRAGIQFPSPKLEFVNRTEYLRRTSFYDILDFKGTMVKMGEEVKEHNQKLKDSKITKGRLRGIEKTVSILLKILIKEMEWYRKNNFDQYLLYISNDTPTLPMYTNRGQISSMDNETPSLRTISTRIQKLMSVIDFISHKKNTSRVTLTRKDQNGNEYKVVKSLLTEKDENGVTKVGRGDFRLQINKKWLCFASIVLTAPKNEAPILQISANSKSTDNQPLRTPKTKNLQQPIDNFIPETLINHTNNCYTNSRSGVATQQELRSAIADDNFNIGDEKGKNNFFENIKEKPNFLKKVLQEIDGKPRVIKLQNPNGQIYLDKFKKDFELRKILPKKLEDHYSALLWYLLINRLYPKLHPETVQTLSKFGIELLKKHILRLDKKEYGLDAAYWIIARAIDKAHDHAAKKDFKFSHPLSYLRFDFSGGLKTVIDEWVIGKELELLKKRKLENQKLMEYQDAILLTETLFLEISKSFHKSYLDGHKTVTDSVDKLEDLLFIQHYISANTKIKIRKDFNDKVNVLIANMEKQASEYSVMEDDLIWSNFENYMGDYFFE